MPPSTILISGAGPVGTLLAIYLAKRGYSVNVYEKRADPRKTMLDDGRSINLALSHRGINALHGAGLENLLLENSIPMNGRMVHDLKGQTSFQPYGETGQYINSVSRGGLNRALIEHAANHPAIKFFFDEKCTAINTHNNTVEFEHHSTKIKTVVPYTLLAGSDGAFSQVRHAIEENPNHSIVYNKLSHGYKELTIASGDNNNHLAEKNALHIWPRGEFMLIALPNMDGSFTCTLFLPFNGKQSFESIKTSKQLTTFFKNYFPDALSLIKEIDKEYFATEPSGLTTVHTFPWVMNNNVFLIGDAAHAIVPFYGQGMNAGFEDVRILNELLDKHQDDWSLVLPEYQQSRKPNADAIAELAMQNFIEMRDLVSDKNFIIRKKIEAAIHKKYPSYLPLYSMVTFSDMPYADALEKGKTYDKMMHEIMNLNSLKKAWDKTIAWDEVNKILINYNVL